MEISSRKIRLLRPYDVIYNFYKLFSQYANWADRERLPYYYENSLKDCFQKHKGQYALCFQPGTKKKLYITDFYYFKHSRVRELDFIREEGGFKLIKFKDSSRTNYIPVPLYDLFISYFKIDRAEYVQEEMEL